VGFVVIGVPLFRTPRKGVAYDTEKQVTIEGNRDRMIWAQSSLRRLVRRDGRQGQCGGIGVPRANQSARTVSGRLQQGYTEPGDKITINRAPLEIRCRRASLPVVSSLPDGRVLPDRGVKGNGMNLNDEPRQ